MTNLPSPIGMELTLEAFRSAKTIKYNAQVIRNLHEYFVDKSAFEDIAARGNPIVYEFWEHEYAGGNRGLSFGLTCIHSGKVGNEFYMTRGHFHAHGEGDECYIVLSGKGVLLLYSKDFDNSAIEMSPGFMYYIPGHMAHRTVNIGHEDLIFLSLWSSRIEHDYSTVMKRGFPKLVIERCDGFILVDNPNFVRA